MSDRVAMSSAAPRINDPSIITGALPPLQGPGAPAGVNEAHSPADLRIVKRVLLGMALVLGLAVCYIAGQVIIPVTLALLLSLLLSPIVTLLQHAHLPRALSSILLLVGLMAALVWGASFLSQPIGEWIAKAPTTIQSMQQRFRSFRAPIHKAEETTQKIESLAGSSEKSTVVTAQNTLLTSLVTGTPRVLAEIAAVLLLIYFFLSSGNTFLRRVIEVAPGLAQKKLVVSIARDVQAEMSRYLVMISVINLGVGVATAISMVLLGVPDPLVWGVLAGLLNFAPYIGPTITCFCLLIVGLTSFNTLGHSLAVPGAFFAIAFIEGQFVTPTIIGRRFALDPALVFVWLLLWGWLWGIAGVLLAGPMIACFRILCEHIDVLKPTGVLIGNGSRLNSAGKK